MKEINKLLYKLVDRCATSKAANVAACTSPERPGRGQGAAADPVYSPFAPPGLDSEGLLMMQEEEDDPFLFPPLHSHTPSCVDSPARCVGEDVQVASGVRSTPCCRSVLGG